MLSACVNSTLSQQNTQAQQLKSQETVTYDPLQRQQAVQEIRQKADNHGSGVPTNAFTTSNGATTPLTYNQQTQRIRELEVNAAQNGQSVTDAELEEKQQSIRQLQSQARSHYKDALKRIEN